PTTTQIYTLSLHDALPISFQTVSFQSAQAAPAAGHHHGQPGHGDGQCRSRCQILRSLSDESVHGRVDVDGGARATVGHHGAAGGDRKSTRLNSSHRTISYA